MSDTPNDLPPVGATVTDAAGLRWRFDTDQRWHYVARQGVQLALGVGPTTNLHYALTTTWREQQAREAAEQRCEWAATGLHGDLLFGQGAFEPLYAGAMALHSRIREAETRVAELEAEVARLREGANG